MHTPFHPNGLMRRRLILTLLAMFFGVAPVSMRATSVIATAPGGQLLWENRGQQATIGAAFAVAVQGDIAVASGEVNGPPDWIVRAVNATTGATLWEDRLDVNGGDDRSQGIVIDGDRVFASGWTFSAVTGFDFVVRAYALASGALLWEHRIDQGGQREFAEVIAAAAGRVFAAGRVLGSTGSSDFTVFAFDAQTGEVQWQSTTDPSGQRLTDTAWALSPQGNRIYASGTVANFSSLLVRAYDAATGSIIWQDEVPNTTNILDNKSLAVQGGTLFASGTKANGAGGSDFLVRAYNADTGVLRWTDQFKGGGISEATALAVDGGRLFAVGYAGCDPVAGGGCDFLVRAYVATSGRLLWQDRLSSQGGDAQADTLAVQGSRLYAGGAVIDSGGHYESTLRAYGTQTGNLVWQDSVGQNGPFSDLFDLTTRGDLLFAAANVENNFSIRAYDIHGS